MQKTHTRAKRKSILKRIAATALATACMLTTALPFGDDIKAVMYRGDHSAQYTYRKTLYNVGQYEPRTMLRFTNCQQKGTLTISKVDEKNEKLFLSGAEFDVIALEDIIIGGEVSFKQGDIVAHGVTGTEGKTRFKLYTGFKYGLKETKAPAGYILDSKITEVDMTFEPNLVYIEKEVSISNVHE